MKQVDNWDIYKDAVVGIILILLGIAQNLLLCLGTISLTESPLSNKGKEEKENEIQEEANSN